MNVGNKVTCNKLSLNRTFAIELVVLPVKMWMTWQ